ncbi:hypothetical protein SteCoe_37896 [Stentor coeruleus]|uniref:VIT domain-containing protein n=1 Tax=Stentor coeruleus TaxID=5963 RepID=A0A1R2AM61_9CILI|nr:hypothetical protein SteCoe_37896 [Stentor coeruleus]
MLHFRLIDYALKPISLNPLKSLRFDTHVQDSIANIKIFQIFTNDEPCPIECDYSLPILDQGVIESLKVQLPDGSILVSHIEEKEKAAEDYSDAISQGHTATMANIIQNKALNVFIGNLGPGEKLSIEVTIVYPLESDEDFWKIVVPSGLIPESIYN